MYCAPLTKEELEKVGITNIYYWFDEWVVFRHWYKNNSKVKTFSKLKITEAKRTHIKSGRDKYYKKITFCAHQKRYSIPLSRLLYVWFIADITEPGLVVDHIDNDPNNLNLDNLQLISIKDNLHKRFDDNPDCWINQYGPRK